MLVFLAKLPVIGRFIQDLTAIRQLVPYFKDSTPLIFFSIILGLLSSLVESIAVGVVLFLIYRILSATVPLPDNKIISTFYDFVQNITDDNITFIWGFIILTILIKSVIKGSYSLLSAHLTNTIHHRIRSALFEKYMYMPYKNLAKMDYGAMTNTLQVESWYVCEVVQALSGITMALCSIAIYMTIIMFLSWQVAIVFLIIGLLLKIFFSWLKQPLRKLGFQATLMHEKLTARILTRMQSLKTIRAHGLETEEANSFIALSDSVAKNFTQMSVVDVYLRPLYDVSIILTLAMIIWFSGYIGNSITLTATIIALLYKLQPYIYGLEGSLMTLIKSQGPLEAILKQINITDIRSEDGEHVSMPKEWEIFQFKNVSFAYDKEIIIKDLNFQLPRGKTLVIKGISGAGKSTLINLFLKLTRPTSGEIWLDNINFDHIIRKEWLAHVAAAGQDFELFDGTLYENLTLGRDISQQDINQALQIAEIKDFTDRLPEGLDTKIGDRGIRLSGGQRQRIVLARAIASNPDFLILDEATSAVSIPVETKIYNNIKEYRPEMTIILITHRHVPENFTDLQIQI